MIYIYIRKERFLQFLLKNTSDIFFKLVKLLGNYISFSFCMFLNMLYFVSKLQSNTKIYHLKNDLVYYLTLFLLCLLKKFQDETFIEAIQTTLHYKLLDPHNAFIKPIFSLYPTFPTNLKSFQNVTHC